MKTLLFTILVATTLAASANDWPAVKQAPVGSPTVVGPEAQLIKLTQLRTSSHGNKVGTRRSGLFCGEDGDLRFDSVQGRLYSLASGIALRKEMEAAGYPKPRESAFEQQTADGQVEYQLGLTVVDLQAETCQKGTEIEGAAWIKADVELFSPRERRVVFRGTFEGRHQTAPKQLERFSSFYENVGRSLARNVLADAGFVENATRRAQPAAAAAGTAPQAMLKVVRKHGGQGNATQQMPLLQSGVATVFSGAGSGSTFLVAADGHWLTNHHVVGDAKYVKVKLANGRELLGEVLRSDARRDVALVKTEAVALAPLEVADAEPSAGAEVFAIGSPLGEKLEGTVTRGVISSVREVEGRRFLQSDVKVLPGSSGGPLIDGRAAVVGITAGGIGGVASGMNLFVPIREALSTLKLDFQ